MRKRVIRQLHRRIALLLRPSGGVVAYLEVWLQRSMLASLAVTNLALAGVVFTTNPQMPAPALVGMHVLVSAVAIAALGRFVPFEACLVLGYAAWIVDDLAARSVNDVLALAACWLGYLVVLASAIGVRHLGRIWIPLVGTSIVVATIVDVSPAWDFESVWIFPFSALAVVVGSSLTMPTLWRLATRADQGFRALEEERQSAALAELASIEVAEDIRVVHDTVINTLGAIANGAADHPELVRARCLSDVTVVEGLLAGRRLSGSHHLEEIAHRRGNVKVEQTGLSESDLKDLGDVLAPEIVSAVVGAVREALRNVEKHAQVERATLDIRRVDNRVHIRVSDNGVGFDPADASGLGLSESIYGRLAAIGADVRVTSMTGRGTEVTIDCPIQSTVRNREVERESLSVRDVAAPLMRRGCWLASAGIVGIGIATEIVASRAHFTWTYAMLALVGACVVIAFASTRNGRSLPQSVALLLTACLSLGFVASMAGIDFGREHVLTYYAVGIAPLLPILISTAGKEWALAAGGLLTATAAVMASIVAMDSTQHSMIVVVGVAPAIGLGVGWWVLDEWVPMTVTRSERIRLRTRRTSLDARAQREISQARQRWGTASLRRAGELLRGIGEAEFDVDDQAVQEACSTEEQYLRQILLLNPRSYRMNVWFAYALAAARSRNILLTIRSGDRDADDDSVADLVGSIVLNAIGSTPIGAQLTVSWFPTAAGPRLGIVGPASLTGQTATPVLPPSWTLARTRLPHQELLEFTIA